MAAARGTTARGYGSTHQQVRRQVKVLVESGKAVCARCKKPIAPNAEWHLGHSDDRRSYRGPEHALCNLRAAAEVSNARRATRSLRSRQW